MRFPLRGRGALVALGIVVVTILVATCAYIGALP